MNLSEYDGVFINKTKLLHCFKQTAKKHIKKQIPKFTKTGSLVSWYNQINDSRNMLKIDNVQYQHIELEETPNTYTYKWDNNNYYVPKLEIS